MRSKRIDENQTELVKQLRKVPGVTITHTHMIGKGVPDFVVGFRGVNYWIELKNPNKPPSQRKLTDEELEWHQLWTGHVAVVETFDDVLKIINQ